MATHSPSPAAVMATAIGLHAVVLGARYLYVEPDVDVFLASLRSALLVFLAAPAVLVAIVVRLRAVERREVLRPVGFVWIVTAVVHGLIVLGAALGSGSVVNAGAG